MSIYAAGKYLMRDYQQPIYVGDRKVKAVYVAHTLVYPESLPEEELYPKYSMWVDLNDEVCLTFENKLLDKAGLIVYAPEKMEIKACVALIFPAFLPFEDGKGNSGVCDVMGIIVECENPKPLRVGAFGMYRGNYVYNYKSDPKRDMIRFGEVKNGSASTELFGYSVILKNGKGISFASDVKSNGMKVAYPSAYKDPSKK